MIANGVDQLTVSFTRGRWWNRAWSHAVMCPNEKNLTKLRSWNIIVKCPYHFGQALTKVAQLFYKAA